MVDEGILSNRDHLPVIQLKYGGSRERYSWLVYELGELRCHGKAVDKIYPSEQNAHRLENIETSVKDLTSVTKENTNSIGDLVENTLELKNVTGEHMQEISGLVKLTNENAQTVKSVKETTDHLVINTTEMGEELNEMKPRVGQLEQTSISDDFYFKYSPSGKYVAYY